MIEFIQTQWPSIVVVLLGVSEVIALVPGVKSNSIFQSIVGLLNKFKQQQSTEEQGTLSVCGELKNPQQIADEVTKDVTQD